MPLDLIITPTGIDEITKRLQSLGKDRSEEKAAIISGVLSTLGQRLSQRLMVATPTGVTGRLRASTRFEVENQPDVTAGDTVYTLSIIQDSRAAGFLYRPIVVKGRRMNQRRPPAAALEGWVQLKWGVAGSAVKPAAFRLASAIASKGTKENLYPQRVVVSSNDLLQQAAKSLGQELLVHITDV